MSYLARCAVILENDISDLKKNTWHNYQLDPRYKIRLKDDLCFEVICEPFDDKFEALSCAKIMYVSLIYYLLKHDFTIVNNGCCSYSNCNIHELGTPLEIDEEKLFVYSPDNHNHYTGLGVFELPNSTDDFDALYSFSEISVSICKNGSLLKRFNPTKKVFSYNSDVETLLYDLIEADGAGSLGLKMTKYCGLLEHIAGMCVKRKTKDDDVISVIDKLIKQTKESGLDKEKSKQIVNCLNNAKTQSSQNKCREVIKKYANEEYGDYKAEDIFKEAYKIRSTYSHGNKTPLFSLKADQIKFILLDVIEGYMHEKENGKCPNNQQQ